MVVASEEITAAWVVNGVHWENVLDVEACESPVRVDGLAEGGRDLSGVVGRASTGEGGLGEIKSAFNE
jgi:hypothetical protein